jgi:hypothetical protein
MEPESTTGADWVTRNWGGAGDKWRPVSIENGGDVIPTRSRIGVPEKPESPGYTSLNPGFGVHHVGPRSRKSRTGMGMSRESMTRIHPRRRIRVSEGNPMDSAAYGVSDSLNTHLRRLPLYPTELRARDLSFYARFRSVTKRLGSLRWGEDWEWSSFAGPSSRSCRYKATESRQRVPSPPRQRQ